MIQEAAKHYGRYMTALGFDWENDPNSEDTPVRVAKAFVNDLAPFLCRDATVFFAIFFYFISL